MSWVNQGRQRHMWFGHGTAPDKEKTQVSDPSVMGKGVEDRVLAIAHGAIAALPVGQRRQAEAQYHDGNLPRLKEAMTAWMRGFRLDQATFAANFLGASLTILSLKIFIVRSLLPRRRPAMKTSERPLEKLPRRSRKSGSTNGHASSPMR